MDTTTNEDGELSAEGSDDRFRVFSEIMENCAKRAKKEKTHVQTSVELGKHCGNWGQVVHSNFPFLNSNISLCISYIVFA